MAGFRLRCSRMAGLTATDVWAAAAERRGRSLRGTPALVVIDFGGGSITVAILHV